MVLSGEILGMPARNCQARPKPPMSLPEVFSARELAQAAGVPVPVVRQLISAAEIPTLDGKLVAFADAIAAVREIRQGRLRANPAGMRPGVFGSALFWTGGADRRSQGLSAIVSTGLHAVGILLVTLLTTVTLTTASDTLDLGEPPRLTRLVFVAEPGPGGGGGGGGLRMPDPPPKAERKGPHAISSPVPERLKPRRVEPADTPKTPEPPLENESLPTIFAPLAALRADTRDIRGLLTETASEHDASQGPGEGGGAGDGGGTGVGEGTGSGVGSGSGGGTGGGPYRAGSGIVAPRLLHEERPDYTEEARRHGIEGDVLLEVVVLSDGTVSNVRILRRLGYGLDEQAVRAIQQWRFAAAERLGVPVDVLVEVAVEFRLR